ncbi:hypothetical protein DPMN_048438 [Dreissena polymorpha]|uniref:Uncharacterized protein n=1 Tax=Dreissena polymorpha TaxID=45954 RepID=A0A9D4I2F0_DREPO|nr:hypothetical protein DPMN_048438 [Dreissena polymorpha]
MTNPIHGYQVLILIVFFHVGIFGLRCWNCKSETCREDPTSTDEAQKQDCGQGQICQKVYFEMIFENEKEETVYVSTVRSCAHHCEPRDDLRNCSRMRHTTHGCVRRDCCEDADLCNKALAMSPGLMCLIGLLVCLLAFTLLS